MMRRFAMAAARSGGSKQCAFVRRTPEAAAVFGSTNRDFGTFSSGNHLWGKISGKETFFSKTFVEETRLLQSFLPVRYLATGPTQETASQGSSTANEPEVKQSEAETRNSSTFDDFQHEEIVGPTVDRDLSETANEVRTSLDDMMKKCSRLKLSLLLMAAGQVLSCWWIVGSQFQAERLFFWFTGLSSLMSIQLAIILHQTTKGLDFFKAIEEKSRMRILTLSLQSIKSFTNFLGRSYVYVSISAIGILLAFISEILGSAT